jgi:hypothetical protein
VAPWHGLDTDGNCHLRLVDVVRELLDYDRALRTERSKRLGVPRYALPSQETVVERLNCATGQEFGAGLQRSWMSDMLPCHNPLPSNRVLPVRRPGASENASSGCGEEIA